MKICKYCHSKMQSEFETNRQNSHRYKGFHVCPKCKAVCEEEVTKNGKKIQIHSVRWFNPETKKYE